MSTTPQAKAATFDVQYIAALADKAGLCLVDSATRNPVSSEQERPIWLGENALYHAFSRIEDGIYTLAAASSTSGDEIEARWPRHTPASLACQAEFFEDLAGDHRVSEDRQHGLDRLSEQLGHSYEELSLIYQLGSMMSVDNPVDAFLRETCDAANLVMETCSIGMVTWDDCVGQLEPYLHGKIELGEDQMSRLGLQLEVAFKKSDKTIICNEVGGDAVFGWLGSSLRQIMAVPMRRQGSVVGCMIAIEKDVPPEVFGTHNRGVFTSIDRKLLDGVGLSVSMYLENRRLFNDAQSLLMGLLHSLVAAVDAKDTYTRGHSVRVALYAMTLAEAAGFDPAYCERVYLAGLLHDVGKIGVEDQVIRKPGKLTDDEFGQIKLHPEIGHRILKNVEHIQDILPGVLYHHEKYNGRGYPHNLEGEDIPLLGRIMCIADSFDAMTSSRTYRKALPIATAMQEINDCAGTQFDPHLAKVWCNISEEKIREHIEYVDTHAMPRFDNLRSNVRRAA